MHKQQLDLFSSIFKFQLQAKKTVYSIQSRTIEIFVSGFDFGDSFFFTPEIFKLLVSKSFFWCFFSYYAVSNSDNFFQTFHYKTKCLNWVMLETVRTKSFLVYDACKTMCVGPTAESNSSKRVSLMSTFNIAESLLVPVMNK